MTPLTSDSVIVENPEYRDALYELTYQFADGGPVPGVYHPVRTNNPDLLALPASERYKHVIPPFIELSKAAAAHHAKQPEQTVFHKL